MWSERTTDSGPIPIGLGHREETHGSSLAHTEVPALLVEIIDPWGQLKAALPEAGCRPRLKDWWVLGWSQAPQAARK
jgi:hypothetical protein